MQFIVIIADWLCLNGDDILVILILMIFKSSNFKYILVTYAWT